LAEQVSEQKPEEKSDAEAADAVIANDPPAAPAANDPGI